MSVDIPRQAWIGRNVRPFLRPVKEKPGRSLRAPGTRCHYDEICSTFDQTRQAILFVHRTFRVFARESAEKFIACLTVEIDAVLAARDAVFFAMNAQTAR
jgi:hypothetical protein